MIYHYCATQAFSSIISTKEVWLTDISKLNDRSEYKSGHELISEILVQKGLSENTILQGIRSEHLNSKFEILIGCFSKEGDLGSQWRLYAEDGQGISIGFDENAIEQVNLFNRFHENNLQPINSKVMLRSVQYDRDQLVKNASNLIDRLTHNNPVLKYEMMAIGLRRLAAIYKDPFFKDEREVRAIIEIDAGLENTYKLDERTNSYKEQASYHKLLTSYGPQNSIKEVIIGPTCSLTMEEIKDMLISNGLSDVQVKYSTGRGKYRCAPTD